MYMVKMLDKQTGEIREIKYDWEWVKVDKVGGWEYDDEFLWSEGNWSCDCNRELDWWRDKGDLVELAKAEKHSTCKGSNRFFVLEIRTPDGKVVYGPEVVK